jgi:hypothetical protein
MASKIDNPFLNKAGKDILKESLSKPSASPDLIFRIMADAEEILAPKTWRVILWPFGPIWKPVAVLTVATLLGIWVGYHAIPEGGNTITDEIELMMVG